MGGEGGAIVGGCAEMVRQCAGVFAEEGHSAEQHSTALNSNQQTETEQRPGGDCAGQGVMGGERRISECRRAERSACKLILRGQRRLLHSVWTAAQAIFIISASQARWSRTLRSADQSRTTVS